MKRKASPSPKASAYFSLSESGESDLSSRGKTASPASSPTLDRSRLSKPFRATPDNRRGLRSPNPSPLSPSRRAPAPGQVSPLPVRDDKDCAESPRLNDNFPVEAISGADRDKSAMERLEYYNDEEIEATEVYDRWAPEQSIEDHYKAGDGHVYCHSSEMDGGREDYNHTPKRFKEAQTARYDRIEPRFTQGRSPFAPRSEIVRGDLGRDVEDRNGDTAFEAARIWGEGRTWEETSRADHRRNGDQLKRGRGGSRSGLYVKETGSSNRPVEADAQKGQSMEGVGRGSKDATSKLAKEIKLPKETPRVERQRPVLPLGRSGGVYIPPFKLARMLKDVEDKSSPEYQRLTWDALRKSINGLVNKVNASNLKNILPELFSENLIRGRGLFARACMKSQMASPGFTHVFAALVAVVNTKFPELGELLLIRIILQLRRAYKRNDKPVLLAAAKFVAHLVNQQVAHEVLALQLLSVLLGSPTDDSVEVAVGFVKECGSVLQNLSPQGLHGIFERFRGILHEGEIDKRVQFMIEGVFALRKAKFQGFPGIIPELDLVEEQDHITHDLDLDDEFNDESFLDVFKVDPNYLENEKKYEDIKKDILGDQSDDGEDGEQGSEEDDSDEEEEDEDEMEKRMQIQDETETNLVNLRRTIYLTIMSSVDFEEAGHKLLKIKLEEGQEMELCMMLLECCSQERTYLRYYGLLGQRFCLINKVYQENFDKCFVNQYSMIHRLETNKLRNVAKFFAHLLGTDALPWQALAYIRLTEEDTTSSSRIFIKILFQELSEHLGLRRLNERLSDPIMQESFDGIFPKDNPKNTRFAINFFTSIGLGGLTDSLREHLKNMPRLILQHPQAPSEKDDSDSSAIETSSGSDSSDSESSSGDSR